MQRSMRLTVGAVVLAMSTGVLGCATDEVARLDCKKPLSGSMRFGGPSGPNYEPSFTRITLEGSEVTYVYEGINHSAASPTHDEFSLTGPVQDSVTLCEAINAAPDGTWRREERVADAHGLGVEVRTGNREFKGDAYPTNEGTFPVMSAARTLNPDLYDQLEIEIAKWQN